MKVGYSYWGFIADKKMDKDGNLLSTPDGNAFYSWSIIKGLQDKGATVYQMMPNRDKYYVEHVGLENAFGMFCTNDRVSAYSNMKKDMYDNVNDWYYITSEELEKIWLDNGVDKFDVILHEWRMLIHGRNDGYGDTFQPDYFIQTALIDFCEKYNVPLIIFDLDYKITEDELRELQKRSELIYLFELGYKWSTFEKCYHVEIPFDYNTLKRGIEPLRQESFQTDLIYIGNRYERDDYIDKYVPDDAFVSFYGNWLQQGYNDCVDRWPYIRFGHRVQASEIGPLYNSSICTILLAKEEYYQNGFMTARILETLFYGCLPLFPIEYGIDIIEKYAGIQTKLLTVRDKKDVKEKIKYFSRNIEYRNYVIQYLRNGLAFMDKSCFVDKMLRIVEESKR